MTKRADTRRWIAQAISVTALFVIAVGAWLARDTLLYPRPASPSATYVGRAACASCHAHETQLFTGSRHDLAMQPADSSTVLGDFSGGSLHPLRT